MRPIVKSSILLSCVFFLLINSINVDAQRKSKNKVAYGIYSSVLYTNSGYGLNYDLNFNVISNKQRFGVGLLMVTTQEILSGADLFYRYNIVENPKIFTKRAIAGLEFFMQAHLMWRVSKVYIIDEVRVDNSITGYKINNDYISAIELLIGPGVHYWINPNLSVDLSLGIGEYVNSPRFEPFWNDQQKGKSGLDYSCRIGLGYKF